MKKALVISAPYGRSVSESDSRSFERIFTSGIGLLAPAEKSPKVPVENSPVVPV
jgi:hypothetical protein